MFIVFKITVTVTLTVRWWFYTNRPGRGEKYKYMYTCAVYIQHLALLSIVLNSPVGKVAGVRRSRRKFISIIINRGTKYLNSVAIKTGHRHDDYVFTKSRVQKRKGRGGLWLRRADRRAGSSRNT